MRRDNIADMQQEIRDLTRRLRDLETANPLANASLMSGRIRILTPGGDGQSHTEEAIIGHAYGKKGFLVRDGADWVTTKEFTSSEVGKLSVAVDGKIATSHEYPNARITSLESFANTFGPTVNTHGTKISGLEGRMTSAEAGVTYTANRVDGLEGRMSNAESSLNGKASVSSVSSVKSKQDEIIDFVNKLQGFVFSQHSGTPSPPLVKG